MVSILSFSCPFESFVILDGLDTKCWRFDKQTSQALPSEKPSQTAKPADPAAKAARDGSWMDS